MNVTIMPSKPSGTVQAPPAKSMAHRLLIAAGLSRGTSTIRGIDLSEDVRATIDCLRALGAQVDICGPEGQPARGEGMPAPDQAGTVNTKGPGAQAPGMPSAQEKTVRVRGTDLFRVGPACLPCRESGSTLRFFTPLCMLTGRKMRLEGSPTLLSRPLSVYEEISGKQGILFQREEDPAVLVQGTLQAGEYELDGSISSQFVTGLLFALPLLDGDSILSLRPPVESRSYIDMTMDALRQFGVQAAWEDGTRIRIPGGQTYRPRDVQVEGDWSNAAFFLALGLSVTGLDRNSLQGDRVCEECFRILEEAGPGPGAHPEGMSLADCPDLGPVLFAFAAMHHGGRFTDTRRLRIKESDRGTAMQEELRKFGVSVEIGDNEILIGSGIHAPGEPLCGHNDHRIVMALAVLCTGTGGTICGAQAVRKSFPDFFRRLAAAGVDLRME